MEYNENKIKFYTPRHSFGKGRHRPCPVGKKVTIRDGSYNLVFKDRKLSPEHGIALKNEVYEILASNVPITGQPFKEDGRIKIPLLNTILERLSDGAIVYTRDSFLDLC